MTHHRITPLHHPASCGAFLGVRIRPSPYWPYDVIRTRRTIPGHALVQWLSRQLRRAGIDFDPDLHIDIVISRPKDPILDRVGNIIYCAPEQEIQLIAAYAPMALYAG